MAKLTRKQTRKKATSFYPGDTNSRTKNTPGKAPEDHNRILNFINLCTKFEIHLTEHRKTWKVILDDSLLFYKLDTSHHPTISMSIKVEKNLKVCAFTRHGQADRKYLKFLLNKECILEYWSQLKNVLQYFSTEDIISRSSIKHNLLHASDLIKDCLMKDSLIKDKSGLKAKLKFIFSQMHALTEGQYTDDLITVAYLIYLKSSLCYSYLEKLENMTLPTIADLNMLAKLESRK